MLHAQTDKDAILSTMKRATQYMMDSLSYRGGFVWNYLPDHSRQWGEMEAYPTMIWMQSPSTPDMGHLLTDAYHATGDEYYYEQACKVAKALIGAQKSCGGWNYMHDFAGEKSARQWYNTIGKQAWRLEEFQHYYGNATFDDEATASSAEFMLRIYMEKKDKEFGKSVEKAIRFVLNSQYKNGGWPQRYPIKTDHPFRGKPDYTPFITLNDDVMMGNIEFLIHCYHYLGRTDLEKPILNSMYLMRDLQYKEPLAGWSDQYTQNDLQPAHARSYEPRAINPATTVQMIHRLARFYTMTGDKSFLKGFDKAYRFIVSQQLPDSVVRLWKGKPRSSDEILVARFIDPDSGFFYTGGAYDRFIHNINMKEVFHSFIEEPLIITNDAKCAAYGELGFGCLKDVSDAAVLVLGTGIGGGVVVEGKVIAGAHGSGGEIGHVHVTEELNEPCNCGNVGCLEQVASATGIVRLAKMQLDQNPDQPSVLRGKAFTAKDVWDAVKAGDEAADAIAEKFGLYLGRALAAFACVTDPEIYVIGGGVSKAGNVILDYVQKYYRQYAFPGCKDAAFALATLGNDAGIYGAAKVVL